MIETKTLILYIYKKNIGQNWGMKTFSREKWAKKIEYGDGGIFHGLFVAPEKTIVKHLMEMELGSKKEISRVWELQTDCLKRWNYFGLLDGETISGQFSKTGRKC